MGLQLDRVVAWGRDVDEYCRMFALTDDDLSGRLLDVGGGPATFTREARRMGCDAIAVDPIYSESPSTIREGLRRLGERMVGDLKRDGSLFDWKTLGSPEALIAKRLATADQFLSDYETCRAEGAYVVGSLPRLPFADRQFDLALCSHLLLLYSGQMDETFHLDAMAELMRVAREVRIFPLLDLHGRLSVHLPAIERFAVSAGMKCDRVRVAYEVMRGANQMLHIRAD